MDVMAYVKGEKERVGGERKKKMLLYISSRLTLNILGCSRIQCHCDILY